MGAIASAVGAIFAKLLEALLGALRIRRQDNDRVASHEEAAVAEAVQETSDVIGEIAAERARVAGAQPDDVDALASSLRARKAKSGGGGRAQG
jgi:hypothetical protein